MNKKPPGKPRRLFVLPRCGEVGIAPGLGPGDRTFEPCHLDRKKLKISRMVAGAAILKIQGSRQNGEACQRLARLLCKQTAVSSILIFSTSCNTYWCLGPVSS